MSTEDRPQRPNTDSIAAMGRDLGRQLADLRQAAGFTQHQMAKLIDYARGTLSAVESGRFDQARCFWQKCDDVLRADGQLVERHDEIKAHIAAARQQQASVAQAERDARLSEWRQTRRQHGEPEHNPPACHLEVAATDVHIWFTTPGGVTHCLIIPWARVSPELLVDMLRKTLDLDCPLLRPTHASSFSVATDRV
jgi:transcriptional regulator with XRE-family HTH domain